MPMRVSMVVAMDRNRLIGADGGLEWVRTEADGRETVFDVEPDTTAFQRWVVWFLGLLPIEWML